MSEQSLTTTTAAQTFPYLALRPKDAAKAIGIGERKLWELTNRGLVPHIRLPDSKCILYPIDALRSWLTEQVQKKGGDR